MVRVFWLVAIFFFLLVWGGRSAPIEGARTMNKVRVGPKGALVIEEKFEGGRRACVIAVGDHNPVVDVGIAVYDEANRLIAEDKGGGDFATAIWYPPGEGKYKILVKN